MRATALPALLAPAPSMHADAHDALYAHATLTATPLSPLLARPPASMHTTPLPSLLSPHPSMPSDAHDALNANSVFDVTPLPPLLAPPPVPLPFQLLSRP
eukprot:698047-Rhodomonas_salina.1